MCGIVGIVNPKKIRTAQRLLTMLHAIRHRGPDGAGLYVGGRIIKSYKLSSLEPPEIEGAYGLGHIRLAIVGGVEGLQPFSSEDIQLTLLHNGEIYNYKKLVKDLPVSCNTDTDSEVVLRYLEQFYRGNLEEAVKELLPYLDGVYTLAVTDRRSIVIARDPMGVRPLYVGRNGSLLAFASERKALYAIDIKKDIWRLPPGHLGILKAKEYETIPFREPVLKDVKTRYFEHEETLQVLEKAFLRSMRKRLAGHSQVGVLFSGGIDSLLVALASKYYGVKTTCYTAGLESSPDIRWAKEAAKSLGLNICVRQLSPSDIEALLPKVMHTIEDWCLNQVEVSVPIYAALSAAKESGERIILTGQGADELFGGYSWYPAVIEREGYENFIKHSKEDTELLFKECLEREDKIAMAHSIELRVPFLDPELVRCAFRISPRLKVHTGTDRFGKHILRRLAIHLGIPHRFTYRLKEAAQHGAKIHDTIEKVARCNGFSPERAEQEGYDQTKTVREVLGSSSRYGYKYGETNLWKPLDHVQQYLDSLAEETGTLNLPLPKT
ncbi:MAG: asparagine synthetase B family protein [bacterium]